jgi:hypothetical protein
MTTRTLLVAGLSPTVAWHPNPGGELRTIEEAVAVARRWGVVIPDDVAFFMDEEGDLDETTTARGPRITKSIGGRVCWSDFVNSLTGRIPFTVRPDILGSDEAIVAVFTHELYELAAIRRLLRRKNTISIEEAISRCAADNPGNSHDEAWSAADEAVLRMRAAEK